MSKDDKIMFELKDMMCSRGEIANTKDLRIFQFFSFLTKASS